jgi:hypothetical protein
MPESFLEDQTMFKVLPDTNVPGFNLVPDTNVPGFRVGLTDDNNESARRPLAAVPSGVASGYDPYSNVLQAMVPPVFRPAGLFYQGNSGLFPTPYQNYVPVSGGSPSQDPLRQAVDRATDPYANSGGSPFPDPLRQAVDRAANPYADPRQPPKPNFGQIVGALLGGMMGGVLGYGIGSPFTGPIGAAIGGTIGGVAPGVMSGPAGQSLGEATAAGATPGGL